MKIARIHIVTVIILLGLAIIFSAIFLYENQPRVLKTIPPGTVPSHNPGSFGAIIINAPLPSSPISVPLYRGYYTAGGCVTYSSPNLSSPKNNIPSLSELPALAQHALEPYGGIPGDAVVASQGQGIIEEKDKVSGVIVAEYLISTNINYEGRLNGMPVQGSGQHIFLAFGENGELLNLKKQWRTFEQIDQVPIINASNAVEKLQRGEVLTHYQAAIPGETITNITLGYYCAYKKREETIIEPVWIFSGTDQNGNEIKYFVDARISGSSLQFANFTAFPTSGSAPLTVRFNDTSTGPVTFWFWDFGDGTSDDQQYPTHVYLNPGTYSVKLHVYDDERDNTIIKTNLVTVGSTQGQGSFNSIIIAPIPPSPSSIPIYRGYYAAGGCVTYASPNMTKVQANIPGLSEVPALAQSALEPYGGIPADAVVSSSGQSITQEKDKVSGAVVATYPLFTNIIYRQVINGVPVDGSGQRIELAFGENGKLLYLYKRWRILNQINEVPIISANSAIEKFQRGELLNNYQAAIPKDTITNITLGYYTAYNNREEIIIEPIWIFSGTDQKGNKIKYFVDARVSGSSLQFANFTAFPISGAAPLTVTFNDTSKGQVYSWSWDFGDGTIGDHRQHPVYIYQNPGNYTVKLHVFDEARDNLITKTNFITVGSAQGPIANFTVH